MIESLDDAWRWYESVKKLVGMMDRVSKRYWSEEVGDKTLKETLHRDDKFREIEAQEIQDHARRVLEDLDDLAVLLLFSVFEADVRSRALEELERELATPPRHPMLEKAFEAARDAIEQGSFGRLTDAYGASHPNDREHVNQVRRFRNWVAHGRRGAPAANTDPDAAFERLRRFLEILDTDGPPPPLVAEDSV